MKNVNQIERVLNETAKSWGLPSFAVLRTQGRPPDRALHPDDCECETCQSIDSVVLKDLQRPTGAHANGHGDEA